MKVEDCIGSRQADHPNTQPEHSPLEDGVQSVNGKEPERHTIKMVAIWQLQ
jgi:hypothetical protein